MKTIHFILIFSLILNLMPQAHAADVSLSDPIKIQKEIIQNQLQAVRSLESALTAAELGGYGIITGETLVAVISGVFTVFCSIMTLLFLPTLSSEEAIASIGRSDILQFAGGGAAGGIILSISVEGINYQQKISKEEQHELREKIRLAIEQLQYQKDRLDRMSSSLVP